MGKKTQAALVEIVLFIAGMLMYHVNIFGSVDLKSLSEKMSALVESLIDDTETR